MKGHFLHISFNWHAEAKVKEVIPTFNHAVDWVRYAPNCWIVWTTSDANKWYERLKPHLDNNDHVFICRLDLDERSGWLPKSIWDWLTKTR